MVKIVNEKLVPKFCSPTKWCKQSWIRGLQICSAQVLHITTCLPHVADEEILGTHRMPVIVPKGQTKNLGWVTSPKKFLC